MFVQCVSLVDLCACPCNSVVVDHLFAACCRELDDISFHKLSNETLEELAEFFEDLGDSGLCSSDFDVTLAVSPCSLST